MVSLRLPMALTASCLSALWSASPAWAEHVPDVAPVLTLDSYSAEPGTPVVADVIGCPPDGAVVLYFDGAHVATAAAPPAGVGDEGTPADDVAAEERVSVAAEPVEIDFTVPESAPGGRRAVRAECGDLVLTTTLVVGDVDLLPPIPVSASETGTVTADTADDSGALRSFGPTRAAVVVAGIVGLVAYRVIPRRRRSHRRRS